MGVPAFFRWLSRKYPNIIVHCVEEKGHSVDGNERVNVDTSKPNPNNVEFDNLYLDMNGIIHPCCHPENKPAPKNEDEMMVAMFEYIDRLFSIIRPRKLLYMAVDGVAPRAKMNQQRSRRFRASKESAEKAETIGRLRSELLAKGYHLPPEKAPEEHFDTNCITPGTPFMDRLSKCLHYYIHDRLNNDPGWKNIEVILSDANVPGEGEHKIVDFIRRQRVSPTHNPNTKHCLCGADADLIMLGLATHEANFTIIREEFKPNQPRACELCGQAGHDMKDCIGLPRDVASQTKLEKPLGAETEFIFIRLNVLREYLTKELWIEGLPFEWSIDRAIDDWVFLCFFVGNDFLPHLPSLEIREGAIDRLVRIYKETVHVKKEYLTKDGFTKLDHCCLILTKLGQAEDEIFRQRQIDEEKFKRRQRERKAMQKQEHAQPSYHMGGQFQPTDIRSGPTAISSARDEVANQRRAAMDFSRALPTGVGIEALLEPEGAQRQLLKRKQEEEDEEPEDDVRLWEVGWKERYYESKFEVSPENQSFRHEVAAAYAEGLCWVLRYYFQGCGSWKWFYPYHYAPFASDFSEIGSLDITFEEQTQPFKPMEQLMSVFPAASRQHLPERWGDLMEDPESPIIDFYPSDFRVDLNGKKAAWMGVALLPFVDEKRLLDTVKTVYDQLTPEEERRNSRGDNYVFIRKSHPGYPFIRGLYENKSQMGLNDNLSHPIDSEQFHGMTGDILTTSKVIAEKEKVLSPVRGCQPCLNNMTVVARWRDPTVAPDFIFPAVMLPGTILPDKVLKPEDLIGSEQGRQWRPQVGMARATQRASLGASGHRMVNHHTYAPPPSYSTVGPGEEHNRSHVRPNRRHFDQDYHRRSQPAAPNYGGYQNTSGYQSNVAAYQSNPGYRSNPGYQTSSGYDSHDMRRPLQDSRGPPRERFGNPANRQPHRSLNDRQAYVPPADRNQYGQRFAYVPPMDRGPYGPRLGFGPPRGGGGVGGGGRGGIGRGNGRG